MLRLRDELDREREERNFFQLERDKVNSFWEISKQQLEETRATVRNKERELEDAEERHQVEIKVGQHSLDSRPLLMMNNFIAFPINQGFQNLV